MNESSFEFRDWTCLVPRQWLIEVPPLCYTRFWVRVHRAKKHWRHVDLTAGSQVPPQSTTSPSGFTLACGHPGSTPTVHVRMAAVFLVVVCVCDSQCRRAAQSLRGEGAVRTVAVVGGGLAGMSVAYHAAAVDPAVGIAIFDVAEPGAGGASAAAAGLLHPLTTRGGMIWRGAKSFESASRLVMQTQAHAHAHSGPELQESPFCFAHGVLRVARTDAQAATYRASVDRALHQGVCADGEPELFGWVDAARARELIGTGAPADCAGGVWCPRGLCVDAPAYLRALWAMTRHTARSALWCREQVSSISDLCEAFDLVVVAVGAASAHVHGLEDLPLSLVRGQTLCWPQAPPEACPRVGVLGGQYLVPLGETEAESGASAAGGVRVIGGATFEPIDGPAGASAPADAPDKALAELRAQLEKLWPLHGLRSEQVPHLFGSGVRAVPPRTQLGSVPLTGRIPGHERNAWYVAGLGGRGILYHAELGRTVALAALRDDEDELIGETRAQISGPAEVTGLKSRHRSIDAHGHMPSPQPLHRRQDDCGHPSAAALSS